MTKIMIHRIIITLFAILIVILFTYAGYEWYKMGGELWKFITFVSLIGVFSLYFIYFSIKFDDLIINHGYKKMSEKEFSIYKDETMSEFLRRQQLTGKANDVPFNKL